MYLNQSSEPFNEIFGKNVKLTITFKVTKISGGGGGAPQAQPPTPSRFSRVKATELKKSELLLILF